MALELNMLTDPLHQKPCLSLPLIRSCCCCPFFSGQGAARLVLPVAGRAPCLCPTGLRGTWGNDPTGGAAGRHPAHEAMPRHYHGSRTRKGSDFRRLRLCINAPSEPRLPPCWL